MPRRDNLARKLEAPLTPPGRAGYVEPHPVPKRKPAKSHEAKVIVKQAEQDDEAARATLRRRISEKGAPTAQSRVREVEIGKRRKAILDAFDVWDNTDFNIQSAGAYMRNPHQVWEAVNGAVLKFEPELQTVLRDIEAVDRIFYELAAFKRAIEQEDDKEARRAAWLVSRFTRVLGIQNDTYIQEEIRDAHAKKRPQNPFA